MSLRLYTDGHIATAIVEQLRDRGINVERCEDVGLKDADDAQHLDYAVSQQRTMVSFDADFLRLHDQWQAQSQAHYGIIRLGSQHIGNVGSVVKEIDFLNQAIEAKAASLEEDVHNKVIYV